MELAPGSAPLVHQWTIVLPHVTPSKYNFRLLTQALVYWYSRTSQAGQKGQLMEQVTGDSTLYQIRVKGVLPSQWSEWIDGTVLSYEDDVTVLACPIADQAALHGLLRQLYSLGLTLISINAVED